MSSSSSSSSSSLSSSSSSSPSSSSCASAFGSCVVSAPQSSSRHSPRMSLCVMLLFTVLSSVQQRLLFLSFLRLRSRLVPTWRRDRSRKERAHDGGRCDGEVGAGTRARREGGGVSGHGREEQAAGRKKAFESGSRRHGAEEEGRREQEEPPTEVVAQEERRIGREEDEDDVGRWKGQASKSETEGSRGETPTRLLPLEEKAKLMATTVFRLSLSRFLSRMKRRAFLSLAQHARREQRRRPNQAKRREEGEQATEGDARREERIGVSVRRSFPEKNQSANRGKLGSLSATHAALPSCASKGLGGDAPDYSTALEVFLCTVKAAILRRVRDVFTLWELTTKHLVPCRTAWLFNFVWRARLRHMRCSFQQWRSVVVSRERIRLGLISLGRSALGRPGSLKQGFQAIKFHTEARRRQTEAARHRVALATVSCWMRPYREAFCRLKRHRDEKKEKRRAMHSLRAALNGASRRCVTAAWMKVKAEVRVSEAAGPEVPCIYQPKQLTKGTLKSRRSRPPNTEGTNKWRKHGQRNERERWQLGGTEYETQAVNKGLADLNEYKP
ncbi:UNVERIFIED_CONTAM: hypothetical protein HHA_313848 [Hammondia hammondi]|eukprot:XP_008883536.1 hypothetical protein HHA_313848 [Hammondia hammondi]